MADLNDLLKSKKVSSFKRKQKARPWTVAVENERQKSKGASPAPESSSSDSEKIDNKIDNKSEESSFKETSTKSIDRPLEPSAGSAGANDMSPTKGIHKSEMSDSHESVKIIDNKKITEYGNPESLLDNKKITTQNTDSPETDNKKITVNRQQIDNKKITNRYQDSISSSNDINKLITNKDNKKITKEEKPFESLDNKKITLEATTSHLIDNKKITTNSDLPRETDNKKITESFYSSAPSTKVVVDKIDNKKITKEDETAELDNKQITESSDKIKESISKTDNKKITENEKQLDNKSITNEYQTDSNQLTSGYQIDSTRLTNEYQTDNYTDNNWITNLEVDTLVGHELKLLLIIFSDCKNSGALITPALNNESLRIRLETSAQVAKMVVHRLIKKGFVRRVDSKKGRGGWTKFGLSRQVYQQLLLGERDNKWISEQITERITTDSSKLIREKNITNSTNQAEEIYEDYSEIDISSLESLGITMKQIRDIKNQKLNLTKNQLESLIEKFAAYANNPSNKVYRPAGLFVKMAQEFAKGEDPLPHIETSVDEEIKALKQRLLAEKAKREREKSEVQELLFDEWWETSSREAKQALVPEGFAKGDIYRMSVKSKWIEEIWPDMPESELFLNSQK